MVTQIGGTVGLNAQRHGRSGDNGAADRRGDDNGSNPGGNHGIREILHTETGVTSAFVYDFEIKVIDPRDDGGSRQAFRPDTEGGEHPEIGALWHPRGGGTIHFDGTARVVGSIAASNDATGRLAGQIETGPVEINGGIGTRRSAGVASWPDPDRGGGVGYPRSGHDREGSAILNKGIGDTDIVRILHQGVVGIQLSASKGHSGGIDPGVEERSRKRLINLKEGRVAQGGTGPIGSAEGVKPGLGGGAGDIEG